MLGTSRSVCEGLSSLDVTGLLSPAVFILFLLDGFLVLGGK